MICGGLLGLYADDVLDSNQRFRDIYYNATYDHTPNEDGTPKKFKYLSLRENGSGDIRLVDLQPGQGDEKIVLKIRNVEFRNRLKYFALSYQWGDQSALRRIHLNDSDFSVGPNLYSALQHLRDPEKPVTLWIDAICIDQGNDKEKSSQLQKMVLCASFPEI